MLEMVAQLNDAKKKLRQVKPLKYVLFHDRSDYDADYLEGFNRMMSDQLSTGKNSEPKGGIVGVRSLLDLVIVVQSCQRGKCARNCGTQEVQNRIAAER
jgi:hypothetical protein